MLWPATVVGRPRRLRIRVDTVASGPFRQRQRVEPSGPITYRVPHERGGTGKHVSDGHALTGQGKVARKGSPRSQESFVRGTYSDPTPFWETGARLDQYGINAVFVHSGSITADLVARARAEGAKVHAEFATLNRRPRTRRKHRPASTMDPPPPPTRVARLAMHGDCRLGRAGAGGDRRGPARDPARGLPVSVARRGLRWSSAADTRAGPGTAGPGTACSSQHEKQRSRTSQVAIRLPVRHPVICTGASERHDSPINGRRSTPSLGTVVQHPFPA